MNRKHSMCSRITVFGGQRIHNDEAIARLVWHQVGPSELSSAIVATRQHSAIGGQRQRVIIAARYLLYFRHNTYFVRHCCAVEQDGSRWRDFFGITLCQLAVLVIAPRKQPIPRRHCKRATPACVHRTKARNVRCLLCVKKLEKFA